LIHATGTPTTKPPLRLRHIQIEHRQECKVHEDGKDPFVGQFVLVACAADNPSLFELFVRSAATLVGALSADPTPAQIETCVGTFVELFRRLQEPSSRTIKGLWAELLIIATSVYPRELIAAWHTDNSEKFDFSRGRGCIEVKASELSERLHEFSLGQLTPSGESKIYVASVLLKRSGGGVGVLDLASRIASMVQDRPDLTEKLWGNVVQALGDDFNSISDIRFNEQYALASLRYVPCDCVPTVPTPLPSEIVDVRFKVDLSSIVDARSVSRGNAEMVVVQD